MYFALAVVPRLASSSSAFLGSFVVASPSPSPSPTPDPLYFPYTIAATVFHDNTSWLYDNFHGAEIVLLTRDNESSTGHGKCGDRKGTMTRGLRVGCHGPRQPPCRAKSQTSFGCTQSLSSYQSRHGEE